MIPCAAKCAVDQDVPDRLRRRFTTLDIALIMGAPILGAALYVVFFVVLLWPRRRA